MKKISAFGIFVIFLTVLFGYPILNGLGCNFNYNYKTSQNDQFASCKLGQYTQIDYPNPHQGNGYTVLHGFYFKFLNNVVVWITSHEDHTKKITPEAIMNINNINDQRWHQFSQIRLSKNHMVIYHTRPVVNLRVVCYKGRLSLFS
jgi:hypothetical protein